MTTPTIPAEGAWSDDGTVWVARSDYPTEHAARLWFSRFTGEPYMKVAAYSRYARHAPEHPAADYYDGEYWVECEPDEPGAFPVWRIE